jgi:hypothetical protein
MPNLTLDYGMFFFFLWKQFVINDFKSLQTTILDAIVIFLLQEYMILILLFKLLNLKGPSIQIVDDGWSNTILTLKVISFAFKFN